MEVKSGYKQTEIGVIPSDWNLVYLKDISSLKGRIGWQGLKQEEFTMNSDQPFLITGMNFKDGEIRWDEVYHVPFDRYELAKEIQLRESDVLMTKDGTIGKMLYVSKIPSPGYATLNSHLLLFRPLKKSYFPKYLYYNFHSTYFKKFIEDNKSGTTFFGISQESVGKYLFILPPIKEQTAIATALSDTDVWINSLEQLLTKKRQIKQGAMQELLQPKKSWEVKKLGNIVDFKNGAAHENAVDKNGKYIIVNSKFISQDGNVVKHSNLNLCPLYKGEITMVMSDIPNGKALAKCYIIEKDNLYTLNQRICAFKAKDDYDEKFIYYKINRNDYYLSFDSGSGQTNLRKEEVLNCPIILPKTKEEQTRIATILSDMDEEIGQLETKLEKAKQLKQGMMQELLTGRIRLV